MILHLVYFILMTYDEMEVKEGINQFHNDTPQVTQKTPRLQQSQMGDETPPPTQPWVHAITQHAVMPTEQPTLMAAPLQPLQQPQRAIQPLPHPEIPPWLTQNNLQLQQHNLIHVTPQTSEQSTTSNINKRKQQELEDMIKQLQTEVRQLEENKVEWAKKTAENLIPKQNNKKKTLPTKQKDLGTTTTMLNTRNKKMNTGNKKGKTASSTTSTQTATDNNVTRKGKKRRNPGL
jgi:hypothetical protein